MLPLLNSNRRSDMALPGNDAQEIATLKRRRITTRSGLLEGLNHRLEQDAVEVPAAKANAVLVMPERCVTVPSEGMKASPGLHQNALSESGGSPRSRKLSRAKLLASWVNRLASMDRSVER